MSRRENKYQVIIIIAFGLFALACILPFALLIIASVTDNEEILLSGYSFFPSKLSLAAYTYLFSSANNIVSSFGISVFATAVGTALSLIIMSMMAYPLANNDMPRRRLWMFFVLFTMLFNGGLVPTYMIWTRVFHIRNTVAAYIFPYLMVKAFYVLLLRSFFSMSIPVPLLESAEIDGAGEWCKFVKIVIPLSYPVLATVGLFQAVAYWNDWFNGMVFITDGSLYSLQNLLNRILLDIQYLMSSSMSYGVADTYSLPSASIRMALAVVGVLPILITYPFFQRFFVKGLTIGAVKG